MVLLLSPFLIILFSVFNTFPILTCLNKYFHNMNNMNALFVFARKVQAHCVHTGENQKNTTKEKTFPSVFLPE